MRAFMIVAAALLAIWADQAHASCQPLVESDCPRDAVFVETVTVTPTIGRANGYSYPSGGIALERPNVDDGQSYFSTGGAVGLPMRDGRPFRLYD